MTALNRINKKKQIDIFIRIVSHVYYYSGRKRKFPFHLSPLQIDERLDLYIVNN